MRNIICIAQKVPLEGNKCIIATIYQMIVEAGNCWEDIWYIPYEGCWQNFKCKFINVMYIFSIVMGVACLQALMVFYN